MSNNHCQQYLPVTNQTANNRPFSAPHPKHVPSAQNHVYSLPISEANNLAQFLLDQQEQLNDKHISAAAVQSPSQDSILAPTITSLHSQPAQSEKVLLGFHNLGHFLDWLDAQQASQEQVHA